MEKRFTPTEKKLDDLGIRLDAIFEELVEFLSLDTSGIPEEGLPESEDDNVD